MFNTQGIDPSISSASRAKLNFFTEEYIDDSVAFVASCESWLKPHISDAQVSIPNFDVIRQDRIKSKRGGVLLHVNNSLPASDINKFDDDTCAAVICTVKSINTKVASIYRPPSASRASFERLLSFLHANLEDNSPGNQMDIIIMGDFNLPGISWEDGNFSVKTKKPTKSEALLLNFMEDHLLSQYVSIPTRQQNTLDLLLTNNPNLVLHTSAEETNISDHKLVKINTTFSLTSKKTKNSPVFKDHTFRNLNLQKANFEDINSHLSSINWDELKSLCTPEEFPELMRLTVLQTCMLYAPLKSDQSGKVGPHLRHRNTLRRRKRKIKPQVEALSRKQPKCPKLIKLRAEIYDIDQKIKESVMTERKDREAKALLTIIENPRYFFSYAKRFAKKKSTVGPLLNENSELVDDAKVMADLLQKQYSSVFSDPNSEKKKSPNINAEINTTISDIEITTENIIKAINEIAENSACGDEDIPAIILKKCKHTLSYPILLIWKESFQRGFIAKKFKTQIITPIHKKDSKAEPANYRPIALTSHIIKVFERIIKVQMIAHILANNILCKNQHGFWKGRSCLTQLLHHIDIIINNLLANSDTDVVYLDFAKAFDKVDHQILLKKLHAYGVRGKLLTWLNCYLSNRWQTVVINGAHSTPTRVISGVPQGTVLGPLLFILYLNDLNKCIKHSVVSSFADDTRLKRAINTTHDTTLLQNDLNSSIKWSEENNMLLHQKKFELVTHSTGHSNLLQELPFYSELNEYHTEDAIISPQDKVRDLGVLISSNLSWSPHIAKITDDARKISSWILSVFLDRSAQTLLPLFKCLVRSRLEYCSAVWSPSKVEDIMRLESVQRSLTARIDNVKHLHYWDRLRELNLMSLQRRRERYIIIQVFKLLHGLAPNDIGLEFHTSPRRGVCCIVPPLVRGSKPKIQRLYDNSFKVVGAKMWNLLPSTIRKKTTLDSFKASLTKYLLLLQDNPPVPGISSANSLLTVLAAGGPTLGTVEDDRGGQDEEIQMARI